MATALGGTQIADTYPGLIKTCDSCTVGSSIQLSDGDGCLTSLFINTAGNGIIACGNSSVNGNLRARIRALCAEKPSRCRAETKASMSGNNLGGRASSD